MRGLLLVLCLAGCLDYDALSNGSRNDQSVGDLGGDLADGGLIAPDLADVELGDQDLAAQDLAGVDLASTPPQLVGTQVQWNSSTNSNSLKPPGGVVQGDLVIMTLWWDDTTHTPTLGGKPFNTLAATQEAGVQSARWYWRFADADEAMVSYTATYTGTVSGSMMVQAYRGAASVVAASAMVRSMADWPTTVTTTAPQTDLVLSVAYDALSGGWTPPAGFSLIKGGARITAFLAIAPTPQAVTIAAPQPVNNVDPFLTAILLVQP